MMTLIILKKKWNYDLIIHRSPDPPTPPKATQNFQPEMGPVKQKYF